jgi:hypothetical protein
LYIADISFLVDKKTDGGFYDHAQQAKEHHPAICPADREQNNTLFQTGALLQRCLLALYRLQPIVPEKIALYLVPVP